MSDAAPLPSRKTVAALVVLRVPSDLNAVLAAYAEGRLVDREAINYEVASKACYDALQAGKGWEDAFQVGFDAALGATDDE